MTAQHCVDTKQQRAPCILWNYKLDGSSEHALQV